MSDASVGGHSGGQIGAGAGGPGAGGTASGSGGATPSTGGILSASGGTANAGGAGGNSAGGGAPLDGGVLDGSGGGSSSGTGGSNARDGRADGASLPCSLQDSPPVRVTRDGQVIELLRIVSTNGPAIDVDGYSGVVIRNVEIRHAGGAGIRFANADGIHIENVSIEHTGAPASGQNPSSDLNNIDGYGSAAPVVTHVRLTRGSSGIYLNQCPDSNLSFIEGHDFRGPFPRGQVVQWDTSDRGKLEDFSVVNPSTSWPEDNVNMYKSMDMQVRRGFIDGNNSPSGVGAIFDGDTSTGVVEDVDAVHMGNGCFSAYAGGTNIVFRRTRCRDNICGDQGRGAPLSNALMWSGHPGYTDLKIEASTYFAACNPNNIVWPANTFSVLEIAEQDFAPRATISNGFCWE